MDDQTAEHSAPQRVGADQAPWPLHGAAATGAIERAAAALEAPFALMQRAGLAVARLALATAPHARRMTVLAGPGNNGGDGLVAALHLQQAGREVRVHLLADPLRLPADAARALRLASDAGVPILGETAALHGTDLLIDALLGVGARRAAEGAIADAIMAINSSAVPVLAIDLPSGLNADTGGTFGSAAVRATVTLSLLTLKLGLFTADGRDLAGEIWFDSLGLRRQILTAAAASGRLIDDSDIGFLREPRDHASHKGSYGDLTVVGGAPGMTGAAWLAARAGLAAGAGRVYISLLDGKAPTLDAARPELMGRRAWWLSLPPVLSAATVVCGCGGGSEVAAALPALLARAGRLLLDADSLNAIAEDPALMARLDARDGHGLPTVLTPHPLEAARLLGCATVEVQRDRLAAAQALADRHRCVVVLKGSGTVVAAPGALPAINPTGNALLASPGTGDVLAGFIGGLWAAGASSSGPSMTASGAARAAVWLHGHAADLAAAESGGGGRLPLRAADLIDAMRSAARR